GILLRAVEEVPRLKADFSPIDERDRADAVPLRLVGEVRRVEWLIRRGREHRHDLREERVALRRRPVLDHEPVAAFVLPRLHDDPLSVETRTLHANLQLVRLLFDELICPRIPDRHRASAVPVGYYAVERQVLDRMVLGMYGEASLSGLERRAVRHGP